MEFVILFCCLTIWQVTFLFPIYSSVLFQIGVLVWQCHSLNPKISFIFPKWFYCLLISLKGPQSSLLSPSIFLVPSKPKLIWSPLRITIIIKSRHVGFIYLKVEIALILYGKVGITHEISEAPVWVQNWSNHTWEKCISVIILYIHKK